MELATRQKLSTSVIILPATATTPTPVIPKIKARNQSVYGTQY